VTPRLLLLVVIGSLFLGGCGVFGGPEALTRPCAVIVDASGSGAEFHADDRVDKKLDPFLRDRGCGRLVFVPLNTFSDTSTCNEEPLNLDPPEGDPESVRKAMRDLAKKRALALLDCARKEGHDSDVLGALRKASTVRPPGEETYDVLVISDMVHADENLNILSRNLDTPDARAQLIAEVANLTPSLPNTVLYPTDLSSNVAEAARAQNIRAFWTELFATDQSGHPTIDMTYG
jgi:hypothetical protein